MRATIFGGYDKRDATRRRPSCSPLSQCPLRAAPAHQPALRRQRCCSAPRWEDGAVRLRLDRDQPCLQKLRRRRAARATSNSRAQRGNEREGFATIVCSGMMTDVGGVCGRTEIAVARWYYHLLVLHLVFLLLLVYHSLRKSHPARSCARFALCVRSTHTYLRMLILR